MVWCTGLLSPSITFWRKITKSLYYLIFVNTKSVREHDMSMSCHPPPHLPLPLTSLPPNLHDKSNAFYIVYLVSERKLASPKKKDFLT